MSQIVRLFLVAVALLPAFLVTGCSTRAEWANVFIKSADAGIYHVYKVDGIGKKGAEKQEKPYYASYEELHLSKDTGSGYMSIGARLVIKLPLKVSWSDRGKQGNERVDVLDGVIVQTSPESSPEFVRFTGEREYCDYTATLILYQKRFWLVMVPRGNASFPLIGATTVIENFLKVRKAEDL